MFTLCIDEFAIAQRHESGAGPTLSSINDLSNISSHPRWCATRHQTRYVTPKVTATAQRITRGVRIFKRHFRIARQRVLLQRHVAGAELDVIKVVS